MIPVECFVQIWNDATLRICAGGGANILCDNLFRPGKQPSPKAPHVIVGDLRNVRADVRKFFDGIKGLVFAESLEPTLNDLDKSIKFIEVFLAKNPKLTESLEFTKHVVSITGCTDRHYQTFSVVDSMYKCTHAALRLVHVARKDTTLVIRSGYVGWKVPKTCIGQPCVVVPICGVVSRIVSTGLSRNFQGSTLALGAAASTDNFITSEMISIDTSGTVLVTFKH